MLITGEAIVVFQPESAHFGDYRRCRSTHFVTGFAGIWHKREKIQKMSNKILKVFRKHPNASERVRTHLNTSERIRTHLNASERIQIRRKTCEKVWKRRKVCENVRRPRRFVKLVLHTGVRSQSMASQAMAWIYMATVCFVSFRLRFVLFPFHFVSFRFDKAMVIEWLL